MMSDYLLCAAPDGGTMAPPPALSAALVARECAVRWQTRGLWLFADMRLPLRLIDGLGFAIGHMFDARGERLPERLAAVLSRAGASRLASRVWGSYVAFWGTGRSFAALRDPSGGLACYHVEAEGWHFLTSMPHLLIDSGLVVATIDWNAIGRSLIRHDARGSATALAGIGELPPGHLMILEAGVVATEFVWDPWTHAGSAAGTVNPELLESALATTLAAWARTANHPLVEISGGLDSAIVAAGVAAAAPNASLITFAAAAGDPDETAYARVIADHLHLPLEVVAPRLEDVDLACSLSRDLPRPNARAFTQAADAQSLSHARAIGADLFLSGGGGDDVFCYLRTILPALDRLRAEGLGPMVRTASDIARMNHATLWEALARIARRLVLGPRIGARPDRRLIAPDVDSGPIAGERAARDRAPPPGKAEHVEGILTIHNYLEGHGRSAYAPIVSPLLSQPVVECCLAVPSWRWCEGGRNRAVARKAFAGRLPALAIERRSKGSFDGFCAQLLEVNRPLVHAMLLEGRLAGQGLLDRVAVAAALALPSPPAATVSRLLALVDVESWVEAWCNRASAAFSP